MPASAPARRSALFGRTVLAIVVLVGLWLVGRQAATWLAAAPAAIEGLGVWGPVAFIVGYAVATVAFVPGSALTLAAGALFGLATGVGVVFLGASLGSTAAFLLARTIARRPLEQRLSGDARFAAIDRAIAAQGRRIVLLLRLSPAFPFSLLNYALGLTRVSLRDYVVAGIGMLPGTVLYVYYGKLAGDVAVLAGGTAPARDTAYYVVLGLGLLATVAVTALVTRTARRALADAGAAGAPPDAPAASTSRSTP
ncbi:MAG: TVP38/TMEM64 family protein [Gemmatimonadaceae bacterium]|nr:TVP38/TMEM64 family protein [Gemmatimonadaceae bacterium]